MFKAYRKIATNLTERGYEAVYTANEISAVFWDKLNVTGKWSVDPKWHTERGHPKKPPGGIADHQIITLFERTRDGLIKITIFDPNNNDYLPLKIGFGLSLLYALKFDKPPNPSTRWDEWVKTLWEASPRAPLPLPQDARDVVGWHSYSQACYGAWAGILRENGIVIADKVTKCTWNYMANWVLGFESAVPDGACVGVCFLQMVVYLLACKSGDMEKFTAAGWKFKSMHRNVQDRVLMGLFGYITDGGEGRDSSSCARLRDYIGEWRDSWNPNSRWLWCLDESWVGMAASSQITPAAPVSDVSQMMGQMRLVF
jgi:hypothetical protein